ncbi:unnamed protein product, partial [Fusarium langsethiae]
FSFIAWLSSTDAKHLIDFSMKVLIILAHPEPKSLNASLFQLSVNEFKAQGHEVKTSDLYSMNWKAVLDRHDFPSLTDARLKPTFASKEAYAAGTLTEDVKTEQEKLLWADFVLFHFPLYWFQRCSQFKFK